MFVRDCVVTLICRARSALSTNLVALLLRALIRLVDCALASSYLPTLVCVCLQFGSGLLFV